MLNKIIYSLCLLCFPFLLYAADILSDFHNNNDSMLFRKKMELSADSGNKADALWHFAKAYMSLNDKNTAPSQTFEELAEAVKKDPNAKAPIDFLIVELSKKNSPDKYIRALLPIAKENPGAIKLNIICISLLARLERFHEAIDLAKGSLDYTADHEAAPYTDRNNFAIILTELYAKTSEWDKGDSVISDFLDNTKDIRAFRASLVFYMTASEKAPDNDGWLWFDSSKKTYSDKFTETLQKTEKFCEANFITAEEADFFLKFYAKRKTPQKSVALLLNNLLIKPDDVKSTIMLAVIYGELKKYSESFLLWRKALSSIKNPNPNFYAELGRSAMQSGHFDEAARALEWFLIYSPGNKAAIYQLALAYYESGMNKKALSKFVYLKDIPYADYIAAMILSNTRDYKASMEYFKLAEETAIQKKIADNFQNKEFYLGFAFVAEKAGNSELAEKILTTLLKKNPRDPEVANFLGYLWIDRNKNFEEALNLIDIALKSDKNSAAYLDSMAWALYKKGLFNEAKKYMTECLSHEAYPQDAVIADHAGDIFLACGDITNALKYWETAYLVYSDDTDSEKILEKINKYKK